MKKLYTEKQYNEYCELLELMANEDDMAVSAGIYLEIEDWFNKNRLSTAAREQMEKRIDDEAEGKIPELKRIK